MEPDEFFKRPYARRLILGGGYLGRRVATAWRRSLFPNSSHQGGDGIPVYSGIEVTVRTTLTQTELQGDPTFQGVPIHLMDVTQPKTIATVLHALPGNTNLPATPANLMNPPQTFQTTPFLPWTTILWTIGFDTAQHPQLTREDVYLEGLGNLLKILDESEAERQPLLAPNGRILFCSSTGVYGDAKGRQVDEDFPCHPLHDGGRVLLAAEHLLQSHRLGRQTTILRLAGLYGEGRIPRAEDILHGKPLRRPDDFVNHIHVTDAVRVIQTLAQSGHAGCYLVTDDQPVTRRTFYSFFAETHKLPKPVFAEESTNSTQSSPSRHGAGSKRASNQRLKSEYGITLRYPTFREGLCETQSDFSVETD